MWVVIINGNLVLGAGTLRWKKMALLCSQHLVICCALGSMRVCK